MKIRPLLAALALPVLACSHSSPRTEAAPARAPAASPAASAAPAPAGDMRAMCPMDVPGTQLAASDTPTGEALTFTTTAPDQVSALRERVRAIAAMHDRRPAAADAHAAHAAAAGMEMPPPSRTAVEDVENGVRMTVTPENPADLAKLQTTVRSHAAQMQQQGCAMMGPAR